MRALGRTLALGFSVAVIVAATLLPGNAIDPGRMPPRWCLACGDLWLTDVVSNVVLFMPLGAALGWRWLGRHWPWWSALAAGMLLSIVVEFLQSIGIPPGRSSAIADVLSNTAGTVVGFLTARHLPSLVALRGARAARLAWLWSAVVTAAMVLTSMALGPRNAWRASESLVAEGRRATIARSPYRHVPAHPWYEAPNDSARVNGHRATQGWSGPIILVADREVLQFDAAVTVRGYDPNGSRIPLLFVHQPADSAPLVMIAEHGIAAELLVTRRAWDWGLNLPVLRLAGAFAQRAPDDPRPLTLSASTSTGRLRLSSRTTSPLGVSEEHSASLALVPTLGWAMLQSLVEVDDGLAPLVLCGWLLALYGPVGWWARRAMPSGQRTALFAVAICVLVPASLPVIFDVAPLPWTQWGLIALCLICGALAAGWYRTDNSDQGASTSSA